MWNTSSFGVGEGTEQVAHQTAETHVVAAQILCEESRTMFGEHLELPVFKRASPIG